MDGRQQRIATHAEIAAKGFHLDKLVPTEKMSAASAGTMGGRAKLDMSGNSISQMLGSANGDMALIMDGGTVSELLLRLTNLDIANSLARLLGGDKQRAADWDTSCAGGGRGSTASATRERRRRRRRRRLTWSRRGGIQGGGERHTRRSRVTLVRT
jgi:hypothetical protein